MRTILWFAMAAVLGLTIVRLVAPCFFAPVEATAIFVAAGICLAAALLGLVPIALIAPRHPDWMIQAGLAAMVIRLFSTLGAGAAYLRFWSPPKWTFLMAGVVFYLVLLAAETGIIVRLVQRHWRAPEPR